VVAALSPFVDFLEQRSKSIVEDEPHRRAV